MIGAPCKYDSDCYEGGCSGNPVVVRYTMRHVKNKILMAAAVEGYGPQNMTPLKYRTYRDSTSTSGSEGGYLVNLVLSTDGRVHFSTPTDQSAKARSKLTSDSYRVVVALENALDWSTNDSVADGHILDFDCTSSGELFLLADLSSEYGSKFNSCLLHSSKPNLEAKISMNTSQKFGRLCVHDESRHVFMLDETNSKVYRVNSPRFDKIYAEDSDAPSGVTLTDLFALDSRKTYNLMGLTSDGLLIARIQDSSYSYPKGLFGDHFHARVIDCDVSTTTGGDVLVISRLEMTSSTSSSRNSRINDVLAFQVQGHTWLLQGPGGYDSTSRMVSFDCRMDVNSSGEARILFFKSCIPRPTGHKDHYISHLTVDAQKVQS